MRDDLSDFDGTPEEFCHLAEAMSGVRAWLKADAGWGRTEPIVDPAPPMSDQPGIEKTHTEVRRKPSSASPGYSLNAAGKKSHHKAKPPHKCADCSMMLTGAAHRCHEHRAAHRLVLQRISGGARRQAKRLAK